MSRMSSLEVDFSLNVVGRIVVSFGIERRLVGKVLGNCLRYVREVSVWILDNGLTHAFIVAQNCKITTIVKREFILEEGIVELRLEWQSPHSPGYSMVERNRSHTPSAMEINASRMFHHC